MKKKFPDLKTDRQAEDFVARADLSKYDFSGFKPAKFELEKKDARLNMRLPKSMVRALKARAKTRDIPYQRLVREALENALSEH